MTEPGTYVEYISAITADPEDDELRLRFAGFMRPYDEPLARFVELQIARARRRRSERSSYGLAAEEEGLLKRHRLSWGHTMAKYTGAFEFYRGLIEYISIDPYLFLEYGDWLMKNAPIRNVNFFRPDEGGFPLTEVLDSPLLDRLDSIGFYNVGFTDRDIELMAGSAHLTRCVWLDLTGNPIGLPAFTALAASPRTRGLLCVERAEGAREHYFPGDLWQVTDRDDRWGAPIWDWGPLPPEGQALEQKYGYLPWLHPKDNGCDRFDARWFFDHGVLPVKPAGSPVGP